MTYDYAISILIDRLRFVERRIQYGIKINNTKLVELQESKKAELEKAIGLLQSAN